MRWVHGSFADCEAGILSDPQIRQVTCFSGAGGGFAKILPNTEVLWLLAFLALLAMVSGRGSFAGSSSSSGMSLGLVDVVLFLIGGRAVALVDDLRKTGSVFLRSSLGFSASVALLFRFSWVLAALTLVSCSF